MSRSDRDWNGNVMLVRPNVLREMNTLHLGARADDGSLGGLDGEIDDFVIDNVVIFYKTK